MAKTDDGKKKVHVPPHKRSGGTEVREHYRSTPNPPKPTRSPKKK